MNRSPELPPSFGIAQARLIAARAAAQPHAVVAALQALAQCGAAESDYACAESHLEEALRWSALLGAADMQVALHNEAADLALRGAERLAQAGDEPAARACLVRALTHAAEAAGLVDRVACPTWEAVALLNTSDLLDRCGQRDEASALQARAMWRMSRAGNGAN